MIKCDALAQNGKDEHSATNGTRHLQRVIDEKKFLLPSLSIVGFVSIIGMRTLTRRRMGIF
jgi:hypothetical protein